MESTGLNILYLYHKVLFPSCSILIKSNTPNTKNIKQGDKIIAYPVRNFMDIIFYKNRIATIAEVAKVMNIDNNYSKMQLRGISRVKLKKLKKFKNCCFETIQNGNITPEKLKSMKEVLRKKSQELIFLINIDESNKLIYLLNFLSDLSQLTDFITNYFVLKFPNRFNIYNEINTEKRAMLLIPILGRLINKLKLKK